MLKYTNAINSLYKKLSGLNKVSFGELFGRVRARIESKNFSNKDWKTSCYS